MEKKYDSLSIESQARHLWERDSIYSFDQSRGPLYSIDTPPPTVSGSLHIGHIFSYTQTDIIARYQRLCGKAVFYPFGFDDNGLPTERFVEKQRGISANKVGRASFIEACLEETAQVEKTFEQLWKQIGLSVDWKLCYATIDERTRKISQASFIDLYKKGFIYRKEEPALFDTVYRTSVAQADLEDSEQETVFNDIVFTVEGKEIIIGTTRPELLASCVAVFYNPADARYQWLEGKKAKVALYGQEVPILADEKAKIDKGTGLVMCCTFGDKTDIEWFKKYNLPYVQSIGFDGKMLENTGVLAGLKIPQARERVIVWLREENILRHQKMIMHNVSLYERSKNPIEYVMLPQWFLRILPYKEDILKAADTINWYPGFMKARFVDWVTNLQWDWCLSRQRTFGIPFPIWYDKTTGEHLLPDIGHLPVDPVVQEFPGAKPSGHEIIGDTDVMDTWNTSSLTPYICQQMAGDVKGFIPMGMRPQAHDIIRTWAFYTIIKAWMHDHTIPWKDIVISGHVLSSEQEKISKSRGNQPLDPLHLLKTYPADVVRYWTASGTLGYDVAFSENKLKIGQKLLVKLWNAALFVREHMRKDFSDIEPVGMINEWILQRSSEMFESYTRYFKEYEFGLALQTIEQFFWQDFCDNYLEIIKDQFFNPHKYDQKMVSSTRATVADVMLRILQLYGPYIPHITEMIYQELFKSECNSVSLHLTRFEDVQKVHNYANVIEQMKSVLSIIAQARKLKSDKELSLKTEIVECLIVASDKDLVIIRDQEILIKGVINAQNIAYANNTAGTSFLEENNGTWRATICLL